MAPGLPQDAEDYLKTTLSGPKMAKHSPQTTSRTPRDSPKRPNMAPRCTEMVPREQPIMIGCFVDPPNDRKIAPRPPEDTEGYLKTTLDCPSMVRHSPKTNPQRPQDDSTTARDSPKRPNMAPTYPKMASRKTAYHDRLLR